MSLYEILGLDKTASQDEIEAAWRKLRGGAHPDREGGSMQKMTDLNHAYQTLSDPVRRQNYDTTGRTNVPNSVEDDAEALLLGLFAQALENVPEGHLLKACRQILTQQRHNSALQDTNTKAKIKSLTRRSNKFKVKDGKKNLIQMLIEQKMKDLQSVAEKLERDLKVIDAAFLRLEDFISEEAEATMMTGVTVRFQTI